MSSVIYRSIMFGTYYRLSQGSNNSENLANFMVYPFLASLAASSSTFLIDKLRSAYLFVHLSRATAIVRKSKVKKDMVDGYNATK